MSNTESGAQLSCGDAPDASLLERGTSADLPAVVELQSAAYARNRELLGVEPLPLQVAYEDIFADHEVWLLKTEAGTIDAALILEVRTDDLLIWSVATKPMAQGRGLGRQLLAAAETRAFQLALKTIRLYTGATLTHLVDWYTRHGFVVERIEHRVDRSVAHMIKKLPQEFVQGRD